MSRKTAIGFALFWFCLGIVNAVAGLLGAGAVSWALSILCGVMFGVNASNVAAMRG